MRRLLLVLLLSLAAAPAAAAKYPWPVKPFDKPHPIRGFFGDPRTVYENGILSNPFAGQGFISFHQGVDISAPNGTPVYAVENGVVHYLGASTLNLVTNHDVTFQYFHITPVAGEGEQVRARRTILGYVQPPFQHVHLTEIDGIHAVNPLQKGHLSPWIDHTKPVVRDVLVRNESGDVQTPIGLCGRIELDVDAFDRQPLPVPGSYKGLPIAPAFVWWSMARVGGKVVVPKKVVADFRKTLPPNSQFFGTYARGTYENSPRFGREQYTGMPGRYIFLLAGNFDTTTLPNGNYTITVHAADVRGNGTTATRRINVLNARTGVCPGSLAAPPATAPPPTEPPAAGGGDASSTQP
jgi:peptidase M23-like protein